MVLITTALSSVPSAFAVESGPPATVGGPPTAAVDRDASRTADQAPDSTLVDGSGVPAHAEELVDERTRNASHYLLPDGSKVAQVCAGPVHYRSAGGWKDIDPRLVPESPGAFTNAANDFDLRVGSDATGAPVTVSAGDWNVSVDLLGQRETAPVAVGDTASYLGAGQTLAYDSGASGVKETLRLYSPGSASDFTFHLRTSGCALTCDGHGNYRLVHHGDLADLGALEPLSITDSARPDVAACTSATTDVRMVADGAYVTYHAPRTWLEDPARVFPVNVDPGISLAAPEDTFAYSAQPSYTYYTNTQLKVGYQKAGSGYERSFVKFPLTDLYGTNVTSATLSLWYSDWGASAGTVYLDRVNPSWADSTLTWASQPASTTPITSQYMSGTSAHWDRFAVADAISYMTSPEPSTGATRTNGGFRLRTGEDSKAVYGAYASGDEPFAGHRPTLDVYYSEPTVSLLAAPTAAAPVPADGTSEAQVKVRVDYPAPSDVRRVDVNAAAGTIARGHLFWSRTCPGSVAATYAACAGGGYLAFDPASDGNSLVVPDLAASSVALDGTGLTLTLRYALRPSYGDVQHASYSVAVTTASGASTKSKVFGPYAVGGELCVLASMKTPDAAGRGLAWWRAVDSDGDGVADVRNDLTGAGRGAVDLSWPACPTASGYRVYLFDGGSFRSVATVPGSAASWTSQGAGLYPSDTQIAAMPAQTAASPWLGGSGLDLRDDPRPLYARTAGTTADGLPAYLLKVTALTSIGEQPIASVSTLTVQLPNRTVGANDAIAHTVYDAGDEAGHGASVLLERGVFQLGVTDLDIDSFGPDASLTRTYRSDVTTATLFAPGWRFGFERALSPGSAGTLTYTDEDGENERFLPVGTRTWTAPRGVVATVTQDPGSGAYAMDRQFGVTLTFDPSGRLTGERDRRGDATTYDWSAPGLSIRAANGHEIDVSIAGGSVTGATYSRGGRTQHVEYDSSAARVARHPSADGSVGITYGYGGGRLASLTVDGFAPGGATAIWSYVYDAGGRITSLGMPHGPSCPPRTLTFAYDPDGQGASMTRAARLVGASADVSMTESWRFDSTGREASHSNATADLLGPRQTGTTGWAPNGAMLRSVSAAGEVRSQVTDDRGNILSESDASGHTTTHFYDTHDQCVRTTDPKGAVSTTAYDAVGDPVLKRRRLSDTQSAQTSLDYDAHGRVTSESDLIDDQGHAAVTTYGDYGDFVDPGRTTQVGVALSSTATPGDLSTVRTFDGFGRILTETDPAGITVSTRAYDLSGDEVADLDAENVTVHHAYDPLGHEVDTSSTAGGSWSQWTSSTVDPTGLVLSQTSYVSSDGVQTPGDTVVRAYDGSGREIASGSSTEGTTTARYDARGVASAVWQPGTSTASTATADMTLTDADGRIVGSAAPGQGTPDTTVYDPQGQVAVEDPAGAAQTTYSYDESGNETSASVPTDSGRRTESSLRDLAGRAISCVDASGVVTTIAYDLLDRCVSTSISGAGRATTTSYNTAGWPLVETDADGDVTCWRYDGDGRVLARSITSGGMTSSTLHAYDMAGREIGTTDADGATVTLTLDPFGQVVRRVELAGGAKVHDTSYSFDERGRQLSSVDAVSGLTVSTLYPNDTCTATVTHAHAGDSTTTVITGPEGSELSRALCWQRGGVSSGATLTVTARDAETRKASALLDLAGGSVGTGWSFDGMTGEVVAQTIAGVPTTYGYSLETGALNAVNQESYGYTADGRIASVKSPGTPTAAFAYDDAGEIVSATGTSMTYAGGEVTGVSTGGVYRSLSYDRQGRRTGQLSSAESSTLDWSPMGRLLRVARDDGRNGSVDSASSYSYDASGQRVRSVATSGSVTTTTSYVYSGQQLLALASETGQATSCVTYLYDDSALPVALVASLPGRSSAIALAIATNQRGDVVGLVEPSGAWIANYSYSAYGSPVSVTTRAGGAVTAAEASQVAALQPLRYAGYVYDALTGLYFCGQRYYDPATCQFLSRDPARADGEASSYQYCSGDPVQLTDRNGDEPHGQDGYATDPFAALRARIRKAALKWVGKAIRYVWGGSYYHEAYVTGSAAVARQHPGLVKKSGGYYAPKGTMDCSAFVQIVLHEAGVSGIPAVTAHRWGSSDLYDHAKHRSSRPNALYFSPRSKLIYRIGDMLVTPGEHIVLVISAGADPEIAECTPTGGRADGTKHWTLFYKRAGLKLRPGSWRPRYGGRFL